MLGAFNLLETSLLLSLAITLILIMFIIYHYKQRIINTEEKTDTMFDIINNMAQEMTNIRNTMSLILPKQSTVPIQHFNKVNVSDDSSDSDDYESGSDSDDDDTVSESDSDDVDTNAAAYDSDMQDHDIDNIKHISIELTNNIDDTIESTDDTNNNDIIDEPEVSNVELNNTDETIVQKINDLDENEIKRKNYRKMNLSSLKEEVLAIGYEDDISKLKKADLINILDNAK